jgi:peptidoglycan-associated lipoprotein
MRHDVRLILRMAVAVVLVASTATLSGCSKKTAGTGDNPDPTQQTPDGGTGGSGADNGSGSQSDPDRIGEDQGGLNDIYFDYDDHTLSSEARSTLSGNASHLKELSTMRVTIEGHCDERGTTEYNLALGQRRADAARTYLVDLGIDASRLATISYGEERPFEAGHDESAYSQNRRAHFRVTNP